MSDIMVEQPVEALQKRRRIMTVDEIQQENSVRGEKRKRLDSIYEQERPGLEADILSNVNELLQKLKRRKKFVAKRPAAIETNLVQHSAVISDLHCACCTTKKEKQAKKYDEETVSAMMSVALETQKEKMFASFIEEHLAFIEQQQQYNAALEPQNDDFAYIS